MGDWVTDKHVVLPPIFPGSERLPYVPSKIPTGLAVYLAGPMRNYPRFNFAAFDKAAKALRCLGYTVISPAEHDRECGFDENDQISLDHFYDDPARVASIISWDVQAVLKADAIVLLPGWEQSEGSAGELAIARWAKKKVYLYVEVVELVSLDD